MNERRRDSSQQQQERISRKQFGEFLEQHEWITDDISPDFGEDIHVRIYEHGISTGLSFDVQLKSTSNITEFLIKSGEISYPFEVKDLEHWDAQVIAIIIAVWDVKRKQGWWIWVDDALQFLVESNPQWKEKETVNIHIPIENEFNEIGLGKLRHLLANLYYPIISKGKDLTISAKLSFPETPEGKAKLAEWQKYFATGDEVEIDREYIESLDFPGWWKKLYGEIDLNDVSLRSGSTKAETPRPVRIELLSETGEENIPYIELWIVKQGKEEITLTNEHQNIPFKFLVVFSKTGACSIDFAADFSVSPDSVSIFRLLKLQKILSAKGYIKLIFLETDYVVQIPIPSGKFPAPDEQVMEFVEKLSFIQTTVNKKIIFPDDGSFSYVDVEAANELTSIIQTGHYQQDYTNFSIEILKPEIEILLGKYKGGQPLYFQDSFENSFIMIFSTKIELGPRVQKIRGYWEMTHNEIQTWLDIANENDVLIVKLVNVDVFQEFENWLKNKL